MHRRSAAARFGLPVLMAIGVFLLAPGLIRTAGAEDVPAGLAPPTADDPAAHAPAMKAAARTSKPYFIEFRARNAQSYGHTFSIHGRLDPHGRIVSYKVSGLHPFTESPIPWMVGHLVLVPSETGASDGDREDQYVLARFRIELTEPEYQKVAAYIKQLSEAHPVWHAVLYNCNAFVGDIAHFMGLKTPMSTMLMPQDYIDGIRDMNIHRTDFASMIGTPVQVEDASALRAAALKEIADRQKGKVAGVKRPAHQATTAARPTKPAAAAKLTRPAGTTAPRAQAAPGATAPAATPASSAPRAQAPARKPTLANYAAGGTTAAAPASSTAAQ